MEINIKYNFIFFKAGSVSLVIKVVLKMGEPIEQCTYKVKLTE